MKDTVKQGILAGLLGTLGDGLVHWTAFFVLGATTTAHYIAQLIYPYKEPTIATMYWLKTTQKPSELVSKT